MPNPTRSCALALTNQLAETLTLVAMSGSAPGDRGTWDVPPPAEIAPGASANGLLIPADDASGTYGWVTYSRASDPGNPIKLTFQCPKTHSNDAGYETESAGLAVPFTATANGNTQLNSCPSQGRPLAISYTIAYRVQSLISVAGSYPLIDTDGVTPVPTVLYSAASVSSKGSITPAVQNPAMFITPSPSSVLSMVIVNDLLTQGGYTVQAVASANAQIGYASEAVPASSASVATVDLVFSSQAEFANLTFNVNDTLNIELLNPKGNLLAQATCPVEIYYPLASPENCWPTGVWVLFLRALYGAGGSVWPASAAQAATNAVNLCFNGFNGQYQYTYYCIHNYGFGGIFALADLLSNRYTLHCTQLGPTLDCLDQANFVACTLSALGIECYTYQTLDPQYISQVSPLGLVQGHYPFYTQQTITPIPSPGFCNNFWWPITNPSNPPPAFQGHFIAAAQINGELFFLDACLGPYAGPAQGYLALFAAPRPTFYAWPNNGQLPVIPPDPTEANVIKFATLCTPRPPEVSTGRA